MINLTIRDFSDINLYSNKNVEKVMTTLVNESGNGVLVSVFDDKVVLFDSNFKEFYSADYQFDKTGFIIENFEKIKLKRDKNVFNESVKSFFRDEASIEDIQESYEEIFSEEETLITEDINKKLINKDDKFSFFNSIMEAKSKVDLTEFYKTELFEGYFDRYKKLGSEYIYAFDWNTPVKVSFDINESKGVFIKTDKSKAMELWKDSSFQKSIEEVSVGILGKKDVKSKITKIFESNKSLLVLSEKELKEVISKTALILESLEGNALSVTKSFMDICKNELNEAFDDLKSKYKLITEADVSANPQQETPANTYQTGDSSTGEKPTTDTEDLPTTAKSDLEKTIEAVRAISEETKDEKAKSFLDNLISKLETMKEDESIDPELLKEIAAMLAPAPEEAPQDATQDTAGQEQAPVTDTAQGV